MGKLIKMNVVIVGMRGLGIEVAKNLILAGPRSVTIYDPQVTSINDLGANFYLE
jgi:ubiquitin-activating enzyme E1